MLRGEISNRPAAICGVDYRILVDVQKSYEWFVKYVPELLLTRRFESTLRKALPLRRGAKRWLEYNWERRFAVITVGVPFLARPIDMIVGELVAEGFHFDDRQEFREWLRGTPSVYRVYTNDRELLGLDGITQPHSGWTEKA